MKHERENEIKEVEEQVRDLRKTLSSLRSENAAFNEEIVQKKKNKTIGIVDLELHEAEKNDREVTIKEYDDQLHELREKVKHLKSANI